MTPHQARRHRFVLTAALVAVAAVGPAGQVAREQRLTSRASDSFSRKVLEIRHYATIALPGSRLTPVYESELNSYLRYGGAAELPAGVREPYVSILGNGRVAGRAVVDLDAVRRARRPTSMLDPANLLAGQVEVKATGLLRSENGLARFELESATVGGVPVPSGLLQDLVSYYSRSPEFPAGVKLDDPFALPARIKEIHVREGQAIVVQR